jgi:hypothetical protein
MDFEKLYMGQKAHIKTRLGYVETGSPSVSKNTQNPKEKGEHSQKLENKCNSVKSAKDNGRKTNHAYQYKYTNGRNRKNNYNQGNNVFNPNWSNKIYFRGPDGWFYELKNQGMSPSWTQRNESQRDILRHAQRSNPTIKHNNKSSNDPRKQAQKLKKSLSISFH